MSAPGKVIVEALTLTNNPIKILIIYYAPGVLLDSKMSLNLITFISVHTTWHLMTRRKTCTVFILSAPLPMLQSWENPQFPVLDGLV